MQGTEKQITWAEQIKSKYDCDHGKFLLNESLKLNNDARTTISTNIIAKFNSRENQMTALKNIMSQAYTDTISHDDAKWWIDHRDCGNQNYEDIEEWFINHAIELSK